MVIARAGSTSRANGRKNISRNFHRLLQREGKLLPVKVSMVKLRVQLHRPRVQEVEAEYPFIRLQDWARYLLENNSKYLLGGFDITETKNYTEVFQRFWRNYRYLDGKHPTYSHFKEFGHVIPYLVHGDEGRGKGKNPILITSYQPLIAVGGEDYTNMKGWFVLVRKVLYMWLNQVIISYHLINIYI